MELIGSASFWLLGFLIVLTPLVFIHELGHYLVAIRAGVRVETFSIGFGPELFGWNDRRGTRWKFSALPLGGYVKMFGEAMSPNQLPADMSESERAQSFAAKPLRWRAAIVAAGPAANFLFAVVALMAAFMFLGQPRTPTTISSVEPGSLAAEAGFQPGDVVIEAAGDPVESLEELLMAVGLNPGTETTFVVRRGDERVELRAVPGAEPMENVAERIFGFGLDFAAPRVGTVVPDSAAEAAGLRTGDVILAANGASIGDFGDIRDILAKAGDAEIALQVERDGETLVIPVTPKLAPGGEGRPARYQLGVDVRERVRLGPIDALQAGVAETWAVSKAMLAGIGQIVSGQRGTEEIGGPIRIAEMSGDAVQSGVGAILGMAVLLSINLGLLNLLPVPLLDGGHLMFYAAEAVRGRPLGPRAQEFGFGVGIALVLSLMVFATYNDVARLLAAG